MSVHVIQAVTSLRVGDGSAASHVNLPLSRESHTRWPFIPGSSLKGALRARATLLHGEDALDSDGRPEGIRENAVIQEVFGGAPGLSSDEESSPMGTLRVCDASLLALPIRSLGAGFLLVTCPLALARFGRVVGASAPPLPKPPLDQVWVTEPKWIDPLPGVQVSDDAVRGVATLEDLDLVGKVDPSVGQWTALLERWLGDEAPLDRLVVVHEDVFAHACAAWTELRTRNAVGADGVVEDSKLFAVETLPPETLLWSRLDWSPEATATHKDLVPEDGDLFAVGGHQSTGSGRIVWFGGQP